MAKVHLLPEQADDTRWKWTADGLYSARSACQLIFQGTVRANYDMLILSSGTPRKCQMHASLAIQGRCNTADQLAKKNWLHTPICTLCQQQPETALQLFGQCYFTRQVWLALTLRLNVQLTPPAADERNLESWWFRLANGISLLARRQVNSLVICTWWHIWKERNARIFKHKSATTLVVCSLI
ncbi:hypothetical protein D1007_20040 [Hordeum vulgare]|nr:hypothetical protein D1007_20040 [Hordeum vulgare]